MVTEAAARRTLTQLNLRLPQAERAALKELAHASGVSVNALLGAILDNFLVDHAEQVPDPVLVRARTIDSSRRRRPHLRRRPQ